MDANPSPAGKTTWALAIATYNRRDVLLECLALAAKQTRPPHEIIVVDASQDWEQTREQVMNDLAPQFPSIHWVYDKAKRPSAAVQRNQCLDLAESDVLFLFDDDSLMYPRCAERLMTIYDDDAERQVVGAAAMLAKQPPENSGLAERANDIEEQRAAPTQADHGSLMRGVRKLLNAEETFVPYDEDYPRKPLPAALEGRGLGTRELMAGMTMTVRREAALQVRFEEALLDRGPEDQDISYRLSRLGALATHFDAEVFHVGSPTGRFSKFSRVATGNLGLVVLHRLHSTDVKRSAKRLRALLWRRSLIAFLKDLKQKQLNLPNTRGTLIALPKVGPIMAMDKQEVIPWYHATQERLIYRKPAA